MMEEFPSIPREPGAAQGGGRDSAARGHGVLCQDIYDFLKKEHIETIVTPFFFFFGCYLNRTEVTRKEEFLGLSASNNDTPNANPASCR